MCFWSPVDGGGRVEGDSAIRAETLDRDVQVGIGCCHATTSVKPTFVTWRDLGQALSDVTLRSRSSSQRLRSWPPP